ncbi:hypothetical protein HY642_04100 [Candidatus Woesearchaeota archaeon]|nr:hypothetical protein [Candidatus Woesearchaeota archaeon]
MSANPELAVALRTLLLEHGVGFVKTTRELLGDLDDHKWLWSEEVCRDIGLEAAVADWNARYGRFTTPEILEIERDFKHGKYSVLEQKLYKFVAENQRLVPEWQEKFTDQLQRPIDALKALQLFLLKEKSIDMTMEIRMQVEEMEKEAWYRGEPDHDRVAVDWSKAHAAAWRHHYALVLEFLLYVRQEKVLDLLGLKRFMVHLKDNNGNAWQTLTAANQPAPGMMACTRCGGWLSGQFASQSCPGHSYKQIAGIENYTLARAHELGLA